MSRAAEVRIVAVQKDGNWRGHLRSVRTARLLARTIITTRQDDALACARWIAKQRGWTVAS